MKTMKFLDRRVVSSLAAFGMLLGMVTPAVVPALVSADVLTTRSIAATSSVANDAGVEYTVSFTPAAGHTFKSIVIDWCSDSPIIGDATCTAPTAFDTSAITATLTTNSLGTVDDSASSTSQTVIKGDGTAAAASAVVLTLAGIHNPSTVGSYYARIYTYNVTNPLATGHWEGTDTLGDALDTGGVALSTTSAIGVSAAVKETMTFCVANTVITAGCGDASSHLPSLTLGEGSPKALVTGTVSTAGVYAQLSTNAASGAVVKMTNSTGCGGLKRVGGSGCDIAPQGALAAITTNQSTGKFGVRVGTPAESGSGEGFGTVTPDAAYASATNYAMDNTTSGDNVSSPYGDAVFASAAPVGNMNVPMTFGAIAGQTTPAGLYKANINLIATGTY